MIKEEHLKDIDFRTKAQRKKEMVSDFKEWYEDLIAHQALSYSERTQGQLTMLTSVLWYILPEKDYKKLTQLK